MIDQAARLRKKVKTNSDILNPNIQQTKSRIIAIASGKGGVGKSNIALNLGLALQEIGQRVLLLDGDLGMANLDILLGLTPMYNLKHILKGKCKFKEAVLHGPFGLDILPGTSGGDDLINITLEEIKRLMEASSEIEDDYDIIILDVGAGVNFNIINFILACDEAIIVLTPEPTSIMDAYSLIKYLVNYKFKGKIALLINRVVSSNEGDEVANRMQKVIKDFLYLDIEIRGFIPEDNSVREAVKKQAALLILYPKSKAGQAVREIANTMVKQAYEKESRGMKGFVYRIIGLFNRDKGSD